MCPGILSCIFLLAAVSASLAQDTNSSNIGLPPNGVFSGSGIDSVQVNNGNLHIEIPLYSLHGRGLDTTVKYVYDSRGLTCSPKTAHD
jgi:hypothetical protein